MENVRIFSITVDLVLLFPVPIIIKASSTKDGYKQCENTVKHWASSSFNSKIKEDKHLLRDLLFFLHVQGTYRIGRKWAYPLLSTVEAKFQSDLRQSEVGFSRQWKTTISDFSNLVFMLVRGGLVLRSDFRNLV
ncbi:Sulfotransferase [Abeliophyllum distichum]|uniref:Sulfotransferase n=1 Tax=Abeliophyllum distichum TaxID=126358 RepID=A0ABD1QE71_9LAMI